MIRGIHHVAVHVRDLNRMVKFYKDAFGFEPADAEFSWDNDETIAKIIDVPKSTARGIMLRAGNCHLELFQYSAPKPAASHPLTPYDRGYTHFCVDVTDIEQECARLKTVGMTFGHPQPVNAGEVTTVYGKDPEGNIIEIQQTAPECAFHMSKLKALAK